MNGNSVVRYILIWKNKYNLKNPSLRFQLTSTKQHNPAKPETMK